MGVYFRVYLVTNATGLKVPFYSDPARYGHVPENQAHTERIQPIESGHFSAI